MKMDRVGIQGYVDLDPRVRRSRSKGTSILDCLPRPLKMTRRSIFRRSIPDSLGIRADS